MNHAPKDEDLIKDKIPQRARTLTGLCIILWISAAVFAGLAVWAALRGAAFYAVVAFASALLLAASGWGLFRMRRWGVIVFAIFVIVGAVNYFSRALQDLLNAHGTGLIFSVINLIIALIITLYMIYLILLLWSNTK